MKKIHLDTDIGGDPDDVCALALLLKWQDVQITGITTVTEDNGRRAGYARYVLELAGREDIPVKAGADISGGYFSYAPDYPDESKHWPEPITPCPNPADEAIELLKQSVEQDAIIIGIGQYTNFFLLDQKYPGILRDAKLFLMGGYVFSIRVGFPQWGNDFDYNIQLDTHSARYVLENSTPTLLPMTVSVETAIRRAYLPRLRQSGKLGGLIATQSELLNETEQNEENFGKTCGGLPADILNFQHDPLACGIALGWNKGVTIEEVPLRFDIQDGLLCETIDESGKPTSVVTAIDGEAFNEFWFCLLTAAR
ncbi:MAG: nucleoside hydrolase [Chloroflexia bacterium]|nr:nucleoside hydrolase [Chloroflexia bacterium]